MEEINLGEIERHVPRLPQGDRAVTVTATGKPSQCAWNKNDPLARMKRERLTAHTALLDYAGMGPGRSIRSLQHSYSELAAKGGSIPTRNVRTLFHWSVRWHWQDRLAAWQDIVRKEREAEWKRRGTEQREWEWNASRQLIERFEQMMRYPLSEQTVSEVDEEGKPIVTVVKPVRWTQRDTVAVAKVAAELARLAAEMETERRAVDVSGITIYLPSKADKKPKEEE